MATFNCFVAYFAHSVDKIVEERTSLIHKQFDMWVSIYGTHMYAGIDYDKYM